MKKIILLLVLFFTYHSISYGYIDYRYTLKNDYFASLKFLENYPIEKAKIDKKIEIIKEKFLNFNYEDKIYFIEKLKEKILTYLYKEHINKNNVVYYKLTYYYNKLNTLKTYILSKYKTKNYSNIYKKDLYFNYKQDKSVLNYYKSIKKKYNNLNTYNTKTNIYTNKGCSLNFYGKHYNLSDGEFKVLDYKTANYRIHNSYKCNNGVLKLIKSEKYDTYNIKTNIYTNKGCSLNFYGKYYNLSDGEFKVLDYKNKCYKKYFYYKCNNGNLKLITTHKYYNGHYIK